MNSSDIATEEKGFTLVELAIVMVIIGLLIGGFLKGVELVQSARVRSVISFVNSTAAATHTFYDKYGALPGDISTATARIKGCGAPCGNGDGDGFVGAQILGSAILQTNAGISSLPEVETTYFWKHLALADLINGIDPQAPIAPPAFGVTHPKSSFGGGFDVVTLEAHAGDWTTGLTLRLQKSLTSSVGTNMIVVTPQVAREIDLKMDDGDPDAGKVAADLTSTGCEPVDHEYGTTDIVSCIMYFSIR